MRSSRLSEVGRGGVAMVELSEAEKFWGRMDLIFLKDMVRFSFGMGVGR